MEALPKQPISPEAPLQILLFVDKRPNSSEKIRKVHSYLKELKADYSFELQVIDVGEQPHLVEYFKLVATPALVKIHPEPRQVLAGSNLVGQLETWWGRWQRATEEYIADRRARIASGELAVEMPKNAPNSINSINQSAEIIRLSDEIFRLQQDKEELQAQIRFKDRLIAMLAHDLRNPLTAASIALETLELANDSQNGESRLTPSMTKQLLRHARTQTKAIDRMITDTLQAANGTGADFQIQPEELDLHDLCEDTLLRLTRQFQAKSQRVETDIPPDLPSVYADPERVRQVLVNLLDNAIKYTPERGTIRVSALHRTSQKLQISICDDGPGIPEENREKIFEDRFRLERDVAKDGYGIGLSLCKRVVCAHFGQIWVDSLPHQGSCFHFTLPVFRR